MTFLSVSLTSLIFSGFVTVLACGSTSAAAQTMVHSTKKMTPISSYSKPGAAIHLASDYDGMSTPGKVESVNFNINHSYPGALLSVSVKAADQIELINAPRDDKRILSNSPAESYELVFSPRGQSVEPITIIAELQLPDGQHMRRTFTMKVNSTGKALQKPNSGLKKSTLSQFRNQKGRADFSRQFQGQNLRLMQEEIIKH